MPGRTEVKAGAKSEETRARTVNAALASLSVRGFDTATMRDIAEEAGVATGAAYYYFPSKEAIVLDFYRRSCDEMQPRIDEARQDSSGLEDRLRALIAVKLTQFAPNRGVLRALLRNGAEPKHPLSPFSRASPNPLLNRDFMWALREAWGVGFGLPGPNWMIEIGTFWMRTESELVLKSRRVAPGRLIDAGFEFLFPEWPAAARDLVTRWRKKSVYE